MTNFKIEAMERIYERLERIEQLEEEQIIVRNERISEIVTGRPNRLIRSEIQVSPEQLMALDAIVDRVRESIKVYGMPGDALSGVDLTSITIDHKYHELERYWQHKPHNGAWYCMDELATSNGGIKLDVLDTDVHEFNVRFDFNGRFDLRLGLQKDEDIQFYNVEFTPIVNMTVEEYELITYYFDRYLSGNTRS